MQERSLLYIVGRLWGRLMRSRLALTFTAAALAVCAGIWLLPLGSMAIDMAAAPPRLPATTKAQPQVSPELIPKPRAPDKPTPKDPNALPDSWQEFKDSPRKDDQALVAQIEKSDWWKNCVAWGVEARKKTPSRKMWALQAKLNSSTLINGVDLGGVKGKIPEVGMTTCGAFAVMGLPEDVNRTKTATSERVQFVWRNPRVYAYTQSSSGDGNALIHSIQY